MEYVFKVECLVQNRACELSEANVRDQGMRIPKMRSLLVVNEKFSDEHNADIGHYGQTLYNTLT